MIHTNSYVAYTGSTAWLCGNCEVRAKSSREEYIRSETEMAKRKKEEQKMWAWKERQDRKKNEREDRRTSGAHWLWFSPFLKRKGLGN